MSPIKFWGLFLILAWAATVTGSEPSGPQEASAGAKAGESRQFIPGIVFRWCPSGTFTMGSPQSEPGRYSNEGQVLVTLTTGFWLGETELTQGQWYKVMGTRPWSGQKHVREGDDFPATYVSDHDAFLFCRTLREQQSRLNSVPDGWTITLPTEAQWEYACRAGTTTQYSCGADEADLEKHAWLNANSWSIGEKFAHPVGSKPANPWGLKDMHGNVYEWCSDWYAPELTGGSDPQGSSSGDVRVHRGGGWYGAASYCRSAFRHDNPMIDAASGIRLAVIPKSLQPGSATPAGASRLQGPR